MGTVRYSPHATIISEIETVVSFRNCFMFKSIENCRMGTVSVGTVSSASLLRCRPVKGCERINDVDPLSFRSLTLRTEKKSASERANERRGQETHE